MPFRCLAYKADGVVELRAKSGKPLARYFPELVAALQRAETNNFVVDGELAVPAGPTLSFQALQARIHPAKSRVMRLAAETPAFGEPEVPGPQFGVRTVGNRFNRQFCLGELLASVVPIKEQHVFPTLRAG
jgi:hypothetical protein